MKPPFSKLGAVLFLAALTFQLASCGRRGALEPPPGVPVSSVPLSGTPGDESYAKTGELPGPNTENPNGAGTAAQATAKHPPQPAPKHFPLDPLL